MAQLTPERRVRVDVQRVAVGPQVAQVGLGALALAVRRAGGEVIVPRPLAAVDGLGRLGRRGRVVRVALGPEHPPSLAARVERQEVVRAAGQAAVERMPAAPALTQQEAEPELVVGPRGRGARTDEMRPRRRRQEPQQRVRAPQRVAERELLDLALAPGLVGREVILAPSHQAAVDRDAVDAGRRSGVGVADAPSEVVPSHAASVDRKWSSAPYRHE